MTDNWKPTPAQIEIARAIERATTDVSYHRDDVLSFERALAEARENVAQKEATVTDLLTAYNTLGFEGISWQDVMEAYRNPTTEEVAPLLKEADADFERLLDEEAAIERSVRQHHGDA